LFDAPFVALQQQAAPVLARRLRQGRLAWKGHLLPEHPMTKAVHHTLVPVA